MNTRMLIDARHREETRVAVVKGSRIEEFDFESAERKQLKGNIYLAKVTRVEPSLQAAFVDYGGNRHGFLAFSEIHPDYYQIPKEDREALLREEAEHAAAEEALRAAEDLHDDEDATDGGVEELPARARGRDDDGDEDGGDDHHGEDGHDDEHGGESAAPSEGGGRGRRRGGNGDDGAVEALRQKRMNLRRRYKIQDVIHRRQVLLVQVVKEERGNKGAALTTYLSLAGRYCVLMPNTSHGGGISRKISNAGDRKRLKSIMAELNLPKTMGCIVRTAGLQRTRQEIKRDFDYLARLWDEIRETTLKSAAPACVYGDSDLIKRAIRDIYNRDIDEVIVEGEDGYRLARSFMKLLMPSHVKKVRAYADAVPLFQRFGVEDQLAAMYQPVVQLKSGGYLVINPTEALVSIDINSGRSTREHNIEQTATATNLEAAHEIARQLRLRDMAGLVVIDFIDMENNGNIRKVEKAMKEALRNDRARIQVGRISSFGLFEMSRQRLRTGVLEASTRQCPHCEGTGLVRTASSAGLSALRMLEDEAARGRGSRLCLRASQEAAFYVLNRKRGELAEIEDRYGVLIEIVPDGAMEGARMAVDSSGPPPAHAPKLPAPIQLSPEDELDDQVEDEIDDEAEAIEAEDEEERRDADERDGEERGEGRGRRRRRRRRRGGRDREGGEAGDGRDGHEADGDEATVAATDPLPDAEMLAEDADERDGAAIGADGTDEEGRRRRGRRGRRGGARRRGGSEDASAPQAEVESAGDEADAEVRDERDDVEAEAAPAAKRPRRRPRARTEADAAPRASAASPEAVDAADADEGVTAPRGRGRGRGRGRSVADVAGEEAVTAVAADVAVSAEASEDAPAKPKRGRRKAADTVAEAPVEPIAEPTADAEAAKPRRPRRKAAAVAMEAETGVVAASAPAEAEPAADEAPAEATGEAAVEGERGPARRGWWQRTFGA